jgi:hypothetical protein
MKKLSVITLLAILVQIAAATTYSVEKAQSIDNFLKRIAKRKKDSIFMKKKSFDQVTLNAYFNLIYLKKYAPEVKKIALKLDKNNYISGQLKIVLRGEKYKAVPSFLKNVEVQFSGKIECQNYRMRYTFDDIRINGTTFAPELLDEAFGAAQSNIKVKRSIFDWFNLLPGIKKVTVDYKKITFFY